MRIIWSTALLGMLLFALPAHAVDALRIAVTSFSAKGGIEQNQLDVLCDMVANEIRSTRLYEVISKSDIDSLLDHEQQKQLVGCDSGEASCLAEIGGALGVDFLVTGNVGTFGGVFAVNLKLIDTKRVRTHNSVFRKIEGGERALLDDLPAAVAELLGLTSSSAVASSPAAAASALPVPHRAAENELASLGFDEAQVTNLRNRKVLLDYDVPRLAKRLLERGFSTADVQRFLGDHGVLDQPVEDRETWAIFYTADIDDRHWRKFRRSRIPLTDYYNQLQESTAVEVFKWLCLGFGTPLALIGALGLADVIPTTSDKQFQDMQIVTGVGGGLVGGFVILLIVDLLDLGYLPDGFLETATKSEILERIPEAGARFEGLSRLQIMPWGDRTSTGLSLGLAF